MLKHPHFWHNSAIVVGGILLKSSDILMMFQNHPVASRLVAFCLAIAAIASVIVLWVNFFVILPFLKSPPKGNSAIFFGDVANHETVQTPILVPRGCINFPVNNPAAGRPAASVCSSSNGVVCR